MHSIETGIIVAIAMFFFMSFLSFTFLRETNISKEILSKHKTECEEYVKDNKKKYKPELVNNILNIINDVKIGGDENVTENE